MRNSKTNKTSGYGRPEIRFWNRVDKNGPRHPVYGRCWVWTGNFFKGKLRYGQLSVQDRPVRAHRFSWTIHYGAIPAGENVLHKCDNPSCVNPSHLFLGSLTDNIHDMMTKGRAKIDGELNGRAVLTEVQVKKIKRLYRWRSREFGTFGLAKRFGVSQYAIMRIISGRGWKNVKAGDLVAEGI